MNTTSSIGVRLISDSSSSLSLLRGITHSVVSKSAVRSASRWATFCSVTEK
jgi:hypothetical protein